MDKITGLNKIKFDNHFIFRERYDYGPFPIAYYYLDFFGKRCQEYYGAKITRAMHCAIGAYEKGRSKAILGLKEEWLIFCQNVLGKILKDKDFVKRTNDRAKAVARQYMIFSRKLLSANYDDSLGRQIINHRKWIWYYKEYSFWNCFLWLSANDILTEHVLSFLKNDYNLKKKDSLVLITSPEPSFVSREEQELFAIALKADLTKNFSDQPLIIKRRFVEHADRWSFIPWDYIGPAFWHPEDFYRRVVEISRKRKTIRRLLTKKVEYRRKLIKKQAALKKEYKIKPAHNRLINDLQMISSMQDDKKEVCGLAQFALQRSIFPYFAKALKITARDCIKFSERELWEACKKHKSLKKNLIRRLKAITSITDIKGTHLLDGEKAVAMYRRFVVIDRNKDVRGQVASVGKASGPIRVLLSPKEIHKVKKGDVLAVIMTTPDYVPAMKKAAAIIADEGGLTSHAAIISRELGIPCIVGTKNGTKILKNGYRVEVDAGRGLVKILN